jgi:hypothetical protein
MKHVCLVVITACVSLLLLPATVRAVPAVAGRPCPFITFAQTQVRCYPISAERRIEERLPFVVLNPKSTVRAHMHLRFVQLGAEQPRGTIDETRFISIEYVFGRLPALQAGVPSCTSGEPRFTIVGEGPPTVSSSRIAPASLHCPLGTRSAWQVRTVVTGQAIELWLYTNGGRKALLKLEHALLRRAVRQDPVSGT